MRSTSKTHARGHFVKKYYDLLSKSFSHWRMPKCGILRTDLRWERTREVYREREYGLGKISLTF